ncbi:MAG TPA: hemolysin III family protein [Bacteroidales bacterium]|nr:hemolysin III family protein [Bacteroidales bacterium]
MKSRRLIKAEELFNSISHGIGVLIAVACLVLLVIFASIEGNVWKIVSFSIFGSSMIALYISSTLYHSTKNLRKKSRRNILDHSMIYVLIAGTYTPVTLVTLRGPFGWTIFGIIWGIAVIGVIYKLFFYNGTSQERKLSAWLYVAMGWIIIIAVVPLIKNSSGATLWFLLAGCLSYCAGVAFYLIKRIPFGHGIWHISILGGTICHFFAFLFMI